MPESLGKKSTGEIVQEQPSCPKEGGFSRREALKIGGVLFGAFLAGDAEGAGKILESAFARGKETKGAPKIKFNILFGYHETAEDARGLEEKIREADIFIPEMAFWEIEDATMLSDIIAGRRTPQEILAQLGVNPKEEADFFEGRRLELMYKFRKRALLLEPPPNHPLRERLQGAMDDRRKPMDFGESFQKIVQEFKRRMKNFAGVQREREAFILDALYKLKGDLEEGRFPDPKLREKEEITIAMFFGRQHTWVHHRIKGWGEESLMSFRTMPYIFGYGSEMMRRYLFGKEVDDALAARALLEKFIPDLLFARVKEPPKDNYAIDVILRRVLSQFTPADIEECFGAIRESPEPARSFYSALEGKFRQKNIRIPQSDEELAEMIKGIYPEDTKKK